MRILRKIAKIFGIITVKEQGSMIRVSGLDGTLMSKEVARLWQNNKVNKYIFSSIDSTGFTFNRFFAPDVMYILTELVVSPQSNWYAKRSLERVLEGIKTNTWFKVAFAPHKPMTDPRLMAQLKWKPMPKQLEFLHVYGEKMPQFDLRGYILAISPGGGKAQDLDSLILTPNGWVRMGDIRVGDLVVTPDGGTAPITALYPQGVTSIYEITLVDGRKARCT